MVYIQFIFHLESTSLEQRSIREIVTRVNNGNIETLRKVLINPQELLTSQIIRLLRDLGTEFKFLVSHKSLCINKPPPP